MPSTYSRRPGRIGGNERPPAHIGRPKYSREQQKAIRAEELLDAAWVLFCEKGYDAVTIEAVAHLAGYSTQPVYTLFGDKQNLFFELQRAAMAEVTQVLIAPLKAGTPLRQNLAQLAEMVALQLAADKPAHGEQLFFVAQTIAFARPDIAEKLKHEAQMLLAAAAAMIRRSTLAQNETLRSEPETIAAHLSAFVNGMTTVQFQTHRRHADAKELAEIFTAIAFRTLA